MTLYIRVVCIVLCEHTIMSLPTTNVNITRVIYNQEPPPCWIFNRIEKCTRYAPYLVSIAGLRLHSIKQTPSTLKWKQFQIILSEKADKWYMFYTTWFRQDALHFERMLTSNDWRDITYYMSILLYSWDFFKHKHFVET